jgi:ketosteroid isomerase-like protein
MCFEVDLIQTVLDHGAAEQSLDIDKIMATVSDNPLWDVWPYMRFDGREAVKAWYERQIVHYYPHTSKKRSLNQWVSGETVLVEAAFVYTPPSDRPLPGRALAIFTFDRGRCASERIYFTGPAFPALYTHAYDTDDELFRIPGVTRY